jgi:hypothetical protein
MSKSGQNPRVKTIGTMRERLSAEAAVQSNRMISAAEERVRKLVGATMTVLSLLSFYVHQDLAYLGAR